MKGLVLKSTGSNYQVLVNGNVVECRLSGRLRLDLSKHTNPVSVGDIAILEADDHDNTPLITGVEERKNYLIRKSTNLSKQTHIIAANIDQLIIVASLKMPRTSTGFIDRLLATAEAYAIPAVILFNKKDLLSPEEHEEIIYLRNVYHDIGYRTFLVSAFDSEDIAMMRQFIAGQVSLFAGHSGVGKSSLMNAIDDRLELRTGSISGKFKKGTHTTTFAEMHPLSFGGYLIDTPGIKEFGLFAMDKYGISDYFPEMFRIRQDCKFNNCLHVNEPGCAVLKAVEEDRIAEFRYVNYLNMLESNDQ